MALESILKALLEERDSLLKQAEALQTAINALNGKHDGASRRTVKAAKTSTVAVKRSGHKMSAKARRAISKAQKERWEKIRSGKK